MGARRYLVHEEVALISVAVGELLMFLCLCQD